MRLSVSKESFLSDLQNKQHFVELLGQHLEEAGITVFHATSDADVLTMQKAIDSADVQDTVLVGDDTDLLVLSLHQELPSHKLYFAPQPKRNAKARIWDIKQVKRMLGSLPANTYCFCMHFWAVTLLPESLALEKVPY